MLALFLKNKLYANTMCLHTEFMYVANEGFDGMWSLSVIDVDSFEVLRTYNLIIGDVQYYVWMNYPCFLFFQTMTY